MRLGGPEPRGWDAYDGEAQPRMGFFTDTSLCIGCKACEVACKEWNELPEDELGFTGQSYDNTGRLSASTWRHVAFVEERKPVLEDGAEGLRWLMASDVCKHCTTAPCLDVCPIQNNRKFRCVTSTRNGLIDGAEAGDADAGRTSDVGPDVRGPRPGSTLR